MADGLAWGDLVPELEGPGVGIRRMDADGLAVCLIRLDAGPGGSVRNQRISLTSTGRDVLAGREDWVRLHGIDRWLGGVHLHGREAQWRWDGEHTRLAPG